MVIVGIHNPTSVAPVANNIIFGLNLIALILEWCPTNKRTHKDRQKDGASVRANPSNRETEIQKNRYTKRSRG